jgi:hypothetical protein
MRTLLTLTLVALALAACGGSPPDNHNEARYGVVTVGIADAYTGDARTAVTDVLTSMQALGPTINAIGAFGDYAFLVDVDTGDTDPQDCYFSYDAHLKWLKITPGCFNLDPNIYRAVVAHAVGHALGMSHVCATANASNGCGTAGNSNAVMYGTGATAFDGTNGMGSWGGQPAGLATNASNWTPTADDIAEYQRTHP